MPMPSRPAGKGARNNFLRSSEACDCLSAVLPATGRRSSHGDAIRRDSSSAAAASGIKLKDQEKEEDADGPG